MINQAVCASFMQELFEGVHNFGPAPDIFMFALFTSSARLDGGTTVYDPFGEATGPEYVAGGEILSIRQPPVTQGPRALLNFSDVLWPVGIAIIARGGLIYNSSKANRAVSVFDFGMDINTTTSGKFGIRFPPNGVGVNPAIMVMS
jgi:DNA-binding beta-propeller fold protein YncE